MLHIIVGYSHYLEVTKHIEQMPSPNCLSLNRLGEAGPTLSIGSLVQICAI